MRVWSHPVGSESQAIISWIQIAYRLHNIVSCVLARRFFLRPAATVETMNGSIWTRREWLAGIAALSVQSLASARADRATAQSPIGNYIDAHVHVWTRDQSLYPRSGPDRAAQFSPASFTPEELFANAKPCGVKRVVLVQMSFFGFDNSYMLDAIAKYKGTFGGVAVIDDAAPNVCSEMRRLARLGVRGFRIVSGKQPENWLDSSSYGGNVEVRCRNFSGHVYLGGSGGAAVR